MKYLKWFLCIMILAGGLITVPAGCGPGKASKIDPDEFEEPTEDDAEEEENYEGDPGDE